MIGFAITTEEHDRLEAIEDAWWAMRAQAAAADGFLGVDASAALLMRLTDATDNDGEASRSLGRKR